MRAGRLLICGAVLLLAGCLLSRKVVTLPADDSLVRDQLVIHSDFRLPRHHRLVDERDSGEALRAGLAVVALFIFLAAAVMVLSYL